MITIQYPRWQRALGKVKTKFKRPPLVLPVCLVGANMEGKPNFEAITWFNSARVLEHLQVESSL
jgi:hypothetical protein